MTLTKDLKINLQAEWFARLEQILERTRAAPGSNLKCLEMCQARCCPRVGMRSMKDGEIASPVVVLLPFEMEFLIEKTGASPDLFRHWPLELTPELTIDVGVLDLGKPCPFLKENMQCGIHEHNPLDCRTFPLLPSLDLDGALTWDLAGDCPSLSFLNPDFADSVRDIWADLAPHLPQAWWDLYAFADQWMGWPRTAAESIHDA